MTTPLFWDQEVLPTRQFNQLNIADVSPLSFNIVEKSPTVNEDIKGEDDRKKSWLRAEGSDKIFSPMVPSERPD